MTYDRRKVMPANEPPSGRMPNRAIQFLAVIAPIERRRLAAREAGCTPVARGAP